MDFTIEIKINDILEVIYQNDTWKEDPHNGEVNIVKVLGIVKMPDGYCIYRTTGIDEVEFLHSDSKNHKIKITNNMPLQGE